MRLSKRLSAVANMVTNGNRVVDVGTDHGYIPIYLVRKMRIPSAIAMDINKGPLERAKGHILEYGLESYIQTRQSDGVKALKDNEGDTLIIAGMGGGLVIKILDEGKQVLSSFQEFILQPQSEIFQVRQYLQENGYRILEEKFLQEDGKFYTIIKAIKGAMETLSPVYLKYGKQLLENKDPVLKEFLLKEQVQYLKIKYNLLEKNTSSSIERLNEIEEKLEYNNLALTIID
ncbi:tRNA (adenine(22)-N(1))-methyltransferase [Anaerosacchariphilus polymeriproducens]|uniref:SAM-dependent methyltransferase n=1 Tax=Anaerosacchariphilus polymeriproducens TaxID=1812858 RepID=A0A371AXW8_9FIRM|nr:class I SAM-dependent methyltransferase [Anaerosacchariphilus polymeriproducens]RDU24340.1 SAM-dependent methyltransferase [Anaerosacchariphilus polymeriproducens]